MPVVPLLVARVEQALDRCPQHQRRLLRLAAVRGEVTVETAVPCRIGITAYRVDRLSRTRTAELFAGQIEAGTHRLAVDARATRRTAYVVARTSGSVLVAPVAGE